MTGNLEGRVCGVVASVFGCDAASVNIASSHKDIPGWDSVGVLNLLMAIEEEFELSVSADEGVRFLSVAEIVTVLRERGVQ
jgi:acyl carrier protein